MVVWIQLPDCFGVLGQTLMPQFPYLQNGTIIRCLPGLREVLGLCRLVAGAEASPGHWVKPELGGGRAKSGGGEWQEQLLPRPALSSLSPSLPPFLGPVGPRQPLR